MLKAVIAKKTLSVELIKELNWLTVGNLFQDDYYLGYREKGQKYGDFKVRNNRIMFTTSKGKRNFSDPLSSPENVLINMQALIKRVEANKNVIEKASILAQELWLNQPFIDGNKRTARLLINFVTMGAGFPLFTYENKEASFNEIIVSNILNEKMDCLKI